MAFQPVAVTFAPNPIQQGKITNLFGSGFIPGEPLNYVWPSIGFSQRLQADNQGRVTASITIDPNRAPGDYTIQVIGVDSGITATGVLTVTGTPSASLPPILTVTTPPSTTTQPTPQPNLLQQAVTGLTSDIIAPVKTWLQAAEQDIELLVRNIIAGIDWVGNVISPVEDYIQNQIASISQDISSELEPFVNQITVIIQGIVTSISADISNDISKIQGDIGTTLANLQSTLLTEVINPVLNAILNLPSQIENSISLTLTDVSSRIDSIDSSIQTGLQAITNEVVNSINDVKTEVNLGWTNIGNGVGELYTSFNSFQQSVTTGFEGFANGLENLASQFFTELESAISQDTTGILTDLKNTFTTQLNNFTSIPQKVILTKSSDDPQTALDNLLVEVSEIVVGITGTYAVLSVLENVHPFHSLHLSDSFKSILEFVGVYDLSRETIKLFIDNGIGLQAEYAINNVFQARKLGYEEFTKGLWYGAVTMDQVVQEAQYEGFEKPSRDVIAATRYKAMPPFILEKLIELQMVSNDFSTQQLLKDGFSPDDTASLQTAFNNLELSAFQSTVRTLIYTMYKDGFIDDTYAGQIMTAFAIPTSQQQWILQTANLEYSYETKLLFATQIIDAYKTDEITDPNEAINQLVQLGMTPIRAKQKIEIEAITQLPALSKTEKAKFFTDLGTLGLVSSAPTQ